MLDTSCDETFFTSFFVLFYPLNKNGRFNKKCSSAKIQESSTNLTSLDFFTPSLSKRGRIKPSWYRKQLPISAVNMQRTPSKHSKYRILIDSYVLFQSHSIIHTNTQIYYINCLFLDNCTQYILFETTKTVPLEALLPHLTSRYLWCRICPLLSWNLQHEMWIIDDML